jgi:hypothetical protein
VDRSGGDGAESAPGEEKAQGQNESIRTHGRPRIKIRSAATTRVDTRRTIVPDEKGKSKCVSAMLRLGITVRGCQATTCVYALASTLWN